VQICLECELSIVVKESLDSYILFIIGARACSEIWFDPVNPLVHTTDSSISSYFKVDETIVSPA